jgi:hypothetical protein
MAPQIGRWAAFSQKPLSDDGHAQRKPCQYVPCHRTAGGHRKDLRGAAPGEGLAIGTASLAALPQGGNGS